MLFTKQGIGFLIMINLYLVVVSKPRHTCQWAMFQMSNGVRGKACLFLNNIQHKTPQRIVYHCEIPKQTQNKEEPKETEEEEEEDDDNIIYIENPASNSGLYNILGTQNCEMDGQGLCVPKNLQFN